MFGGKKQQQAQISEMQRHQWTLKSTIEKRVSNVESVEVCSLFCIRAGNLVNSWLFNASNHDCSCFQSTNDLPCNYITSFTISGLYFFADAGLLECSSSTTTYPNTPPTTPNTPINTPSTTVSRNLLEELKVATVAMTLHQIGAWSYYNKVKSVDKVEFNETCSQICIDLNSNVNAWVHYEETKKCNCLQLPGNEVCCPSQILIDGILGLTTKPVYIKMSQIKLRNALECFMFSPFFNPNLTDLSLPVVTEESASSTVTNNSSFAGISFRYLDFIVQYEGEMSDNMANGRGEAKGSNCIYDRQTGKTTNPTMDSVVLF